MASLFSKPDVGPTSSAREDVAIIGVAVALLLVLAAAGHSHFDVLRDRLLHFASDNTSLIASLLLLNLAASLYGWRRFRGLRLEVEECTAAEKRGHSLALTDPLTGLLNRRGFSESVEDSLQLSEKQKRPMALLVFNVDGFRAVNDVHGHMIGDTLLRVVADIISKALPKDALRARLGGDEFAAAFLFDGTHPATVQSAAEAIFARLRKPIDLTGIPVQVSLSLGLARSDADGASGDSLFRRADIAMHAAKTRGGSRLAWFDSSMERQLQERNSLESDLRSGIDEAAVIPYFEQQIDMVSGTLQGFEVLARWQHPERGLVMPDTFIPIAEACGLIGDLSISVMRQAFQEARSWDASLTLSVNISPSQLQDPWLAQKMLKLLVETGFPGDRLEVEITESSLFENLGLAQSIIGSLKNQGIRIALDDFGTGYSSLAHLRALPFDRIKIDRSFVTSINDSSESAAVVNAVTRLADSLNLAITAEGVEDNLIEARLRAIGNYKGQGWLYGKPMPAAEVRKLLADKRLLPSSRARQSPGEAMRVRRAG